MALPGVLARVFSPLQCCLGTEQRAWSSRSFHPAPCPPLRAAEGNNVRKLNKKAPRAVGWGTAAQHSDFGVIKVLLSEAWLFPEGDFMLLEHPLTQPRAWSSLRSDARWEQDPPCQCCWMLGHIHPPALGAGWPGDESAVSTEKMWVFFFFFLACAQPAGLRWLRGAPGRHFFHPEGFEPGGCSTCPLPARGDAPGGLEMIGGGRQQAGTGVISSPKPLQGSFGFLPPVNRLNGKRAWLGATETLLLHVISLITS